MVKREQAEFLRRMIIRYNRIEEKKAKENLRNEIYEEILPYMIKWISSILSKKGVFLSREELISKSWDCFLYSLEHFKMERGIPVPNHFYSYSGFFILNENQKERKIKQSEENYQTGADCSFEILDTIEAFKKSIKDPIYLPIFEDALHSMLPANKDKQTRMKEINLSHIKYQESKKIFKWVIDFLIRKGA